MTEFTPINKWAEDDRPREKLLLKGRQTLSDTELIAILLGSGSRNESAVELARRILQLAGNNLDELGKISISELMKLKGMGEAKSVGLVAAMELGRRRKENSALEKTIIKSSRDAYNELKMFLQDLQHEEFWILLMNRQNKLLCVKQISMGGITATVADVRIIYKIAIENNATSIILSHNHPSGNRNASEQDKQLTMKLQDAGKLLDINIHDHIIIAGNDYLSFADEGML